MMEVAAEVMGALKGLLNRANSQTSQVEGAFMFSCFKIKPSAATIITLTILFIDFILQEFPFFKPYVSYFVTYRMSAWVFLLEQHLSWPKIVESYAFLMGLNVTLFTIGWMAFQSRDFKT